MGFLNEHCLFRPLRVGLEHAAQPFSCGDDDLDGFFSKDYIPYEEALFGKSYCFITREAPHLIVAAFTVCNASIHNRMLSSSARRKLMEHIAEEKGRINFPAVLIGRLGVGKEFQDKHIGTEVMTFLKGWFTRPDNKTGCRFLMVDAYNNPSTISYYLRNGFEYMIPNADSEKRYRRLENVEGDLHTRLMRFDLILTQQPSLAR